MTDLLSPTDPAIAAVLVAVFAGLIAAHMVWIIIHKLQRRQAKRRADAELTADLLAAYPKTMTEEQCRQMNTERWDGD
jgi:biopolymer transport protein ExbB/TolQ